MLTNYEDLTFELTKKELELVPNIVKRFNAKLGLNNAVKGREIVAAYDKAGIKLGPVRLKKIIQYIRINGLVDILVGHQKGYFRAATKEEARNYLETLGQDLRTRQALYDQIEYSLIKKEWLEPQNRLKVAK